MMTRVHIAVLLLAFALPTSAATYYVDREAPNASDDNPGTQAAPWRTISRSQFP